MADVYHKPVLLHPSVDGLVINPDGVYVDATFGGGGHSREILSRLKSGKLYGFDQDVDAKQNVLNDERFVFVQHNFQYVKNFMEYYGEASVDGVLADLGVSSHEFDVASRGFSFRFEGDLDMRMNQSATYSAYDVVNTFDEEQLVRMFSLYGELKNARRTATSIIDARNSKVIKTTTDLCEVVAPLVSDKVVNKYLAKVFQSIRIEVNQEIEVLKSFLTAATDVLKPGGRLVVISYHSLEDRLVKNLMLKGNFEGKQEQDFYGNVQSVYKVIGKKQNVPDADEIKENSRARSARLRIAEKL